MNKTTLLEGPVRGTMLRFALPIMLSMVTTRLYSMVDAMIVGLCLDADALAAVSSAYSVLTIFLFVSGGMELGGSLLAAAARPGSTPGEMSRLTWNILAVDLGAAVLMLAGGLWGMRDLLVLINTPQEILEPAALYGIICLAGLPCMMLYDLARQLVIGCGESKVPLYAVIATSALNIVLDLLLVGPLGVAGAAAATSIAQAAGCVFMLRYLRRTLLVERFRLRQLDWRLFGEIMGLSVPNMLQQAGGTAVVIVRQALLGPLGVAAIAGFSSAGKLSSLLLVPVYGLMQSLVVFIAQNRAAGQPDRAEEGVRSARVLLLGYTALVVALCALASRSLIGLFTTDQEAMCCGALLLSRACWTFPVANLRHLQEARLRGRKKMTLYLASSTAALASNILACLALVPRVGFPGFYLATYISTPLGLLFSTALVRLSNREPIDTGARAA